MRAAGEKERVAYRTPARVAVAVSADTAGPRGGGTVSEATEREPSAVSSGSKRSFGNSGKIKTLSDQENKGIRCQQTRPNEWLEGVLRREER